MRSRKFAWSRVPPIDCFLVARGEKTNKVENSHLGLIKMSPQGAEGQHAPTALTS